MARKKRQPTIGDRVRVHWTDISDDSHADNPDDVEIPEFITQLDFLGYRGAGKRRHVRLCGTYDTKANKPYGILAIPAGNIISLEVV